MAVRNAGKQLVVWWIVAAACCSVPFGPSPRAVTAAEPEPRLLREPLRPEARFDIADFGASPSADAATNTEAIQRALDAAAQAGGLVRCAPGRYALTKAKSAGLDHRYALRVRNTGGAVWLQGPCTLVSEFAGSAQDAARHFIMLRLEGRVEDLTIERVSFDGGEKPDAAEPERWVRGIWSTSGNTVRRLTVRESLFSNLIEGVSMQANDLVAAGVFSDALIVRSRFENIVGTFPGTGYGVNDSGSGNTVAYNSFRRTGRHALYVSNARDHLAYDNLFSQHRVAASQNLTRAGVNVARSSGVRVLGNRFEGFYDGALNISASTVDARDCRGVEVRGNTFSDPGNTVAAVSIGEQLPDGIDPATGVLTKVRVRDVTVEDNRFSFDLVPTGTAATAVRLIAGHEVAVRGNLVSLRGMRAGLVYTAISLGTPSQGGGFTACAADMGCVAGPWLVEDNVVEVEAAGGASVVPVALLGKAAEEPPPFERRLARNRVRAKH